MGLFSLLQRFVFCAHCAVAACFQAVAKELCVRVYPARAAHAVCGLQVERVLGGRSALFPSPDDNAFFFRHDIYFKETVEVSIGADACYLHVQHPAPSTAPAATVPPPFAASQYCFIRFWTPRTQHPHAILFHVMCAANHHSDALPYVAFLDSWILDRPGLTGQVGCALAAAAACVAHTACAVGDAGLVSVSQCCC